MNRLLKSRLARVPEAGVLQVANEHGDYVFSSLSPVPDVNIADRPFFLQQKERTDGGMVISEPLLSRTLGGAPAVSLSKRINHPDGSFAGVVNVVVLLDQFEVFYRTINLGPRGAVLMRDEEMRLLVRHPRLDGNIGTAMPDHPRVLAEIGATLGKMGLKEKADGYWERIDTLGAIGAGPFHPLAAFALRGETLPGTKSAGTPGSGTATEPAKTLKIGKIDVAEDAPTSEGQKVSLRVLIEAAPGAKPAGEDLSLLVYFYDRVPDGSVRPSTADTSYLYPTEPYDWQVDGTEVIVVNYLQPVFTEEQKRELGERSFYGYAIELYYRDELQDKVAMPEDIAALRFDGDSGSEDSRGGAPGPTFLGPENALFPDSVVP